MALGSEPRRLALVVAAALGMAIGFYPGSRFISLALCAAAAFAAFGNAAIRSGLCRSRGAQGIALALGLAAGACVAWNEAGRAAPVASASITGGAPSDLSRLSPSWVEGRLLSDSAPAKNGFRSYSIRVERLGLIGRGVSAELSYPKAVHGDELRVLARAGREIDSGSLIRARGSFSGLSSGGL